jgi:Tol biopolymer transport system component
MSRHAACSVVLALLAVSAPAQVRLTTASGGGERQPVISADGRTIAYVAMVGSSREVFTVPSAGGTPVARTSGAQVRVGNGTFDVWPSLSISADGTRITYWNAAGVHVIDTVAASDTVVANANAIPYPQIDETGQWVVYQAAIAGWQEVFLVSATGGTPQQLTTNTGAGRRLPDITSIGSAAHVLFQAPVAGFQELFAHDVNLGSTVRVTQNSGPGNRHGRFADGTLTFAYESTASGQKEVWTGSVGGSTSALTTAAHGGDRLAVPSEDAQVFYQGLAVGKFEVHRIDSNGGNGVVLTASSTGGLRRVGSDAHGHTVVYQSGHNGQMEVFTLRLCPEATFTPYGVHGQPSVGTLSSFQDWSGCALTFGIATSLTGNNSAAMLLSPNQQLPGLPLPNAPGNFLYVQNPIVALPLALDGAGRGTKTLFVDSALAGTAFYQWAILDVPANGLGIVTSEGMRVDF